MLYLLNDELSGYLKRHLGKALLELDHYATLQPGRSDQITNSA